MDVNGPTMRISELAESTGVSVATIKYYVREGLLPPGRRIAGRLAEYDETHARRLRLLRVLREVGHVPVVRLREIVEAPEESSNSLHDVFGLAADALAPRPPERGRDHVRFRESADRLIQQGGWTAVRDDAIDRDNLAAVLEALETHSRGATASKLTKRYVEIADRLGKWEVEALDPTAGRGSVLEEMVVAEVLFGQLLLVLRRLAHEHHSARRFGDAAGNERHLDLDL